MGLVELPGFRSCVTAAPAGRRADREQTDIFAILDDATSAAAPSLRGYDPVVALLAQAADDPDVLAIKQTLYRASSGSPILASLQRAAERNKQVTVILELTARFDEERNIRWARALEEVGAHVIYGVRGYKIHAKVCLIVRRLRGGLRRYVHLGTGNYNERTARVYTDFGLLTTSPVIAADASAFFSALTGYSDPPRLKKLVMAPTGLRQRFLKLIDRERRGPRRPAGGDRRQDELAHRRRDHRSAVRGLARRCADPPERSRHLRAAARCAGVSDDIEVVSVVDRFLEHRASITSSTAATRSLPRQRRLDDAQSRQAVELMFPIEQPEHKVKVLDALRAMFRDTEKSRWLQADGTYCRRTAHADEPRFRVQEALHEQARRTAAMARERTGVTFKPKSPAVSKALDQLHLAGVIDRVACNAQHQIKTPAIGQWRRRLTASISATSAPRRSCSAFMVA
jgi:polyphosphate kinase